LQLAVSADNLRRLSGRAARARGVDMRRPMVAGNWKMHGSRASNEALLDELESSLETEWPLDIAVFPPYVYLSDAARRLKGGRIEVGAQDVCAEAGGAFTGQVGAAMLKDVGCTYVIVGHSERRRLNHEDDALVARKFVAAQRVGLIPVLCVGESLEEREAGMTETVVGRQLDAVITPHGVAGFSAAILAYEPVWAIGTGRTATPEQAQAVHAFLRARIAHTVWRQREGRQRGRIIRDARCRWWIGRRCFLECR
jgi:triosephosphate isomerase (TIM)